MQVSTASATILVISCHSCSIVKLIKVYITEPSCICNSYKSECTGKQCVYMESGGGLLSLPLVSFIHVVFTVLVFLDGTFNHSILVTIRIEVRIQLSLVMHNCCLREWLKGKVLKTEAFGSICYTKKC